MVDIVVIRYPEDKKEAALEIASALKKREIEVDIFSELDKADSMYKKFYNHSNFLYVTLLTKEYAASKYLLEEMRKVHLNDSIIVPILYAEHFEMPIEMLSSGHLINYIDATEVLSNESIARQIYNVMISGNTNILQIATLDLSNDLIRVFKEKNIDIDYSNPKEVTNISIPGKRISLSCVIDIARAFPNLEILDINTTQIDDEAIKEVIKLNHLKQLDISGNTALTNESIKEISKLKDLEWLDISVCNVDDACLDSLMKLEKLESLLLSATKISVYSLGKLSCLKNMEYIDLTRSEAGDRLPFSLVESKSFGAIMSFIQAKSNPVVPIGNYRLMLLGEPGSGKTTMMFRLTGAINKEVATLGINIQSMDYEVAGEDMKDTKLNIWDFGGQSMQTSIHELFLTENCLFSIFLEPRMNDCENDFMRWYEIIKKHWHAGAKNQFPLIVCFTKIDQKSGGLGHLINNNYISELRTNIKELVVQDYLKETGIKIESESVDIRFVYTSSVEETGIDEFKKVIIDSINKSKDVYSLTIPEELKTFGSAITNNKSVTGYYLTKIAAEEIFDELNITSLSLEEGLSILNS